MSKIQTKDIQDVSDLKDYFEDIEYGKIFLIDKKVASNLWINEIDKKFKGYFSLPDNHWIIANEIYIGDWLAPNSEVSFLQKFEYKDIDEVANLLQKELEWEAENYIRFHASPYLALRAKWKDFLLYWKSFLTFENECPIVMRENNKKKEAIIFTPNGQIRKSVVL